MTPQEYKSLMASVAKVKSVRKRKAISVTDKLNALLATGISEVQCVLDLLMERSLIPQRCTLEPEQRICIEFADKLREYTLNGAYAGIWGHIANEGKRHPLVAIILKRMGLIPGSADYFFMWNRDNRADCGVIEFKTPSGVIQPIQKLYKIWCTHASVQHAYARSPEEGIAILQKWGALPGNRLD